MKLKALFQERNIFSYVFIFCLTISCLIVLNIVTAKLPTTLLFGKIEAAFNNSSLTRSDVGGNIGGRDSWRGQHQFQDCLVLMQALNLGDSWVENALVAPKSGQAGKCQWLWDFVFKEREIEELKSSVEPYYQYNHGAKSVAFILVSLMPLDLVRTLLKFGSTVLIGISGFTLIMIGRRYEAGVGFMASGVATIIFLTNLHGIDFFGQNLSHGLSDWVSLGYLSFLLYSIYRTYSHRVVVGVSIIFGCLAAYIEYFVGLLPFCLISIPIYGAIKFKVDEGFTLDKVIWIGLAFCASFIGTFLVFLLAKYFFIDKEIFSQFIHAFMFRVDGLSYGRADTYYRLYHYALFIGSGSKFTVVLYTVSLFLIIAIQCFFWRKNLFRTKLSNALFLAAAALPFVWYSIFVNHTYIHCWFMVRLITLSYISLFMLVSLLPFKARDSEKAHENFL
ncbi:MAG: hypothetical protein V7746_12270 [Halioglobus sp.]